YRLLEPSQCDKPFSNGALRSARSISAPRLVDVPLRDRHPAPEAERATGDLDAWCCLLSFVFVNVHPALYPPHGLILEAAADNVACAHVFLDVEPEDFVEHIVRRQGVLVGLPGF